MPDPDLALDAAQHMLAGQAVPEPVLQLAGAATPELAWRNDLGGLTFRIRAIADGLLTIHAVPVADYPAGWTETVWVGRRPANLGPCPAIDDPVLVHGDACAPNTLISDAGRWTGNVDFGDLAVSDRWADLAIASLSLDWNFGEGHQVELFAAYGVTPDAARIRYWRALWEQES